MFSTENCFCGAWRAPLAVLLCATLFSGSAAVAQKDKKKKKEAPASESVPSPVPLRDEQAIDLAISEMLGAWQIGDSERLHKYYADDVSVVSGAWEPPVVGWPNFLASYQKLHARMQQIRKERENTYIRVQGNFSWVCFQWDFSAVVDGQPMTARGQTTLLLEKRSGNWVIVHDHSSLVQSSQQVASPPRAVAPPPAQTKPLAY